MAPGDFRLPRRVERGWIIGGHHYEENPLHTTPQWARSMVSHWARLRAMAGGGMMGAGAQILPKAGGYSDQSALVMDAFMMFNAWMAERNSGDGGQ